MLVYKIGKGKVYHHESCGMVSAAIVHEKPITKHTFNSNMSTCRQCCKAINKEVDAISIGITPVTDVRPVFRITVLGPFQMEEINEERLNKLVSEKAKTHAIRIGVPTQGKMHPLILAVDNWASKHGFTCIEVKRRNGQYPTQLNEWMINSSDAVVIFDDGRWITKRAIKYCQENNKRVAILEVA